MSLNTLANEAVNRRNAVQRAPAGEVLSARGANHTPKGGTVPDTKDALSAIAKYIPVEIVTLFLFGLSVVPHIKNDAPWFNTRTIFWGLVLLTPVVFWLLFAAKFRAQEQGKWPAAGDMPWFALGAATIGFAIWANALPNTGLWGAGMTTLFAALALGVSTVLDLIDRAIHPKKL